MPTIDKSKNKYHCNGPVIDPPTAKPRKSRRAWTWASEFLLVALEWVPVTFWYLYCRRLAGRIPCEYG